MIKNGEGDEDSDEDKNGDEEEDSDEDENGDEEEDSDEDEDGDKEEDTEGIISEAATRDADSESEPSEYIRRQEVSPRRYAATARSRAANDGGINTGKYKTKRYTCSKSLAGLLWKIDKIAEVFPDIRSRIIITSNLTLCGAMPFMYGFKAPLKPRDVKRNSDVGVATHFRYVFVTFRRFNGFKSFVALVRTILPALHDDYIRCTQIRMLPNSFVDIVVGPNGWSNEHRSNVSEDELAKWT